MTIERKTAEQIVLARLNRDVEGHDRFVIGSCELSPQGDCWIIVANSAAYLEHGDFSQMYVGVNAYLVDSDSGEVEIVGSGEQVEDVLQDRYDLQAAEGQHYVLCCNLNRNDKHGLILLHRVLGCGLVEARLLVGDTGRCWLHGRRRALRQAVSLLCAQGLKVAIELHAQKPDTPELDEPLWNIDELKNLLLEQIEMQQSQPPGEYHGD